MDESLAEESFDATRVARFLRGPGGALRVAVVNVVTGAELASFPIDRTREGMARVMAAVVEVRERIAGKAAPAAAQAVATIADLRRVYLGLMEHDRMANHLPERVTYQSPELGEIVVTRSALRAIDLDDLFSAGRTGDAVESALLRAISDTAGAADPSSSVAFLTFSPERWRGYRVDLVMRRTPNGVEVDAPTVEATRAAPPADDVAAANATAEIQARLQAAYEAAVSEFLPDSVDGGPTSNEILAGMPSFDDIAALVAAGRGAEAAQRVALIERRLYAARRGEPLANASRGAALAPPGSFRAFVTAPPPPPPPAPAGPFGAVPYEDSGRFFGTVVQVAEEGRTSPAWQAVVFNVGSKGETVEVTSPMWDGRWSRDVPRVEIPSRRVGAVVLWHDAKGERGTPFDPYANRDMPESKEADRRVQFFRDVLKVDLRAAPATPTTVVLYQGDGLFIAASGAADPKHAVSGGALASALANAIGAAGPHSAYAVRMDEASSRVRRAVNETVTKHAGGHWNAATMRIPLVPDPERVYRAAAIATAEGISWWFEERGFHRYAWAHVTIAGPPFTSDGPTYETYVTLRSRLEEALASEGVSRNDGRAWATAGLVREAITGGKFSPAMDPSNKAARKVFSLFTGVELPASLKATHALLDGRRTFPVVYSEGETVKLNGRRRSGRAKRNTAIAAREESRDERYVREDGFTNFRTVHTRTPSFVREYGEPVKQLTGPEYAALEEQLVSVERDAGWQVHDEIEPYRRDDGSLFVADVGVWQAPPSPRRPWKPGGSNGSVLRTLLERLQQRLLPGLKVKDHPSSGPRQPEFAHLDRVPVPTLPELLWLAGRVADDAEVLRAGKTVWNAARNAARFIEGIDDRAALGIATPDEVLAVVPVARDVVRLAGAAGDDDDYDD